MKKIVVLLLIVGLCMGCSAYQTPYSYSEVADEMQTFIDQSNHLMKDEMEIDKLLTDGDPNTTDQIKIKKALNDLKRADKKVISLYEQKLKDELGKANSLQTKIAKLDEGESKQLAQRTIQSLIDMIKSEQAYAIESHKYAKAQIQFFSILEKGQEPSDTQIDQFNKFTDEYGQFEEVNKKIDVLNKNWDEFINKVNDEF